MKPATKLFMASQSACGAIPTITKCVVASFVGLTVGLATADAKELQCRVVAKVDTQRAGEEGRYFPRYEDEHLEKAQFAVIVRDRGDSGAELGRCSYSTSAERVTCDFYEVDYVARDPHVGHTKYYAFRGHFDVQVFAGLTFLENNGRGSLAYGSCEEIN